MKFFYCHVKRELLKGLPEKTVRPLLMQAKLEEEKGRDKTEGAPKKDFGVIHYFLETANI
jgi:hypothetical protein